MTPAALEKNLPHIKKYKYYQYTALRHSLETPIGHTGDLLERPGCLALKLAIKGLRFSQTWTTAWHHGMRDAPLKTHFQSLNSPTATEEERPSLETPN